MKEQIGDLTFLERKFREDVELLEHQLEETKRKLSIISEAIELLKKEGVFDQDKLFQFTQILSDRYKNMRMREAIEDVLRANQGKKASAEFIMSELIKHGFQSKSKNLKRDVYTRLFRLRQRGILGCKKEGRLKKYYIKEDKIEEEIKNEKGGI